ncbi:DoxX family protein [Amycolatopsis orientalis]|uniref:DoxX family protein n=1 Tax=Amycolatopsis orientalis TaxID=31958 RepID=UPI00039FDD06|nr:DoxX family protein [Amycolatopsis orientalis]
METGLLVATFACIAINAFEVVAKVARARFVVQNSAEVGVRQRWLPYLAALEGAGVVGLIVGLLGWPGLGLAAAIGLTLFFVGAVGAHVRAKVFHNIAFPAVFLALAVAAAGYFTGSVA